jgi:hypothetical protein
LGFLTGTKPTFLSDHPEEKAATLHPDDFVFFLSFSDETRISGILCGFRVN